MDQPTLPQEENNARLDTPDSLSAETGLDAALRLHTHTSTLEPDAIEVLATRVSQLRKQNQKRTNRLFGIVASWVSLLFFFGILTGLLGQDNIISLCLPVLIILIELLGLVYFVVTFHSGIRLRQEGEQVVQTLANLNDVRAVGPLTDTLNFQDRENHRTAIDALIHLLPHIQVGDDDLLNSGHRALLWSKLIKPIQLSVGDARDSSQAKYSREIAFRVAILQAFTQVGDSRAIPGVAQLAQEKVTTAGEQCIQQAAQTCLSALRQRAGLHYSNKTLLRASSASEAGTETLLRATQGVQEIAPDQLLRPGPPDS